VRAFLFAGQLSETPGMGRDFHEASADARRLFDETSERTGVDLRKALFEGGEAQLRDNRIAQPAVLLVSTLAARELSARGITPSAVCGYSLGNYAALVCAGAVSYDDALSVLLAILDESNRRGLRGAMGAVIGIAAADVERVCARLRGRGVGVWIGNVNAATQLVLSGTDEGVDAALSELAPRALKAFRLPMTWGIHTPLMSGVSEAVRPVVERLSSIRAPVVPLYSPHTARPLADASEVAELLAGQVASPSRWKETIEAMFADGHHRYLEVGPGDTLTRILRWIVREGECAPAGTIAAIASLSREEEHGATR
jgi:[acyl-carrier-protein] S-malonyltransferase